MGLGFLFPVVGYFFIWLWSSLGLLRVLLAIVLHPFTALKKTARESEGYMFFSLSYLFIVRSLCLQSPRHACWTPAWVPTSM